MHINATKPSYEFILKYVLTFQRLVLNYTYNADPDLVMIVTVPTLRSISSLKDLTAKISKKIICF